MIKDARDSHVGLENIIMLLTRWPRQVSEAISFERLQPRKLEGVDLVRPQNFKRRKAKLTVCAKV